MAWRAASATICSRRLLKNGSAATRSAPGPCLHDIRKGRFDLGLAAGVEDRDFFPDRAGRRLGFSDVGHSRREIRVHEHRDGRGRGNEIVQQSQTLLGQLRGEDVDSGRIAAGSGEAGDEPQLDRIGAGVEHDGDRCGRGLDRSSGSFAADRDDDGDLAANEIGRQRRHPLILALGPAVLDRDVAALDEASFLQALAEAGDEMRERTGRRGTEEPNHRHRRLLRARRRAANAHAAPAE